MEESAGRIPPPPSLGFPVHRGDGLALKDGWVVGSAPVDEGRDVCSFGGILCTVTGLD